MAAFRIQYDERAVGELAALRKSDQVAIMAAIERHLSEQPTLGTRSSVKKLVPPVLADYRLRAGDYRVFYDVHADEKTVLIVAVRYKGTMTLDEAAHGSGN